MAAAYEVLFKKRREKIEPNHRYPRTLFILLFLAFTTAILFWVAGFTAFTASTIAMALAALIMFFYRNDLLVAGFISGILMAIISLAVYIPIVLLWPQWVETTYFLNHLSGILVFGVPIEEFIFWFLAGLIFGPLYEYREQERFR